MAQTKVTFGPYVFEPASGRLSKGGNRLKLQPKPRAILTCLLESPGELVKREDLQKRLWPEGTFVDFDLGLNVAVRKLREALNDSADTPAYVQTIPGEGYRFIAPVSGIGVPTDAPQVPATTSRRRGIYWTVALVATATVAISLMTAFRATPLNFQSRDWVLIAAFENRTGEKLLDGTLEFALERELSQSRYVNVAPRGRVNDTLLLMRQSPSAMLTEDLARQVAVRDGSIKGVLAGRIEKSNQKYVLSVRLLNPASGEIVAAFGRDATQSGLLDAARSVSDELRRDLGERALDAGSGQDLRLERATTPSLAALRAFSAGMKLVNQLRWEPAAALLEEAIREDPQFASAHIYAAHCYSNVGQDKLAAPHYQAAYRLAPGVGNRERLFILGSYYARFLQDVRRALASYQALVSLYPDDYWGANNLGLLYERLNMIPERNEVYERLEALRPNANLGRLGELWRYYKFDNPDKAKAQQYVDKARRLQRAGLVGPGDSAYLDLETAADRWRSGDVKGAAQEVARFNSKAMNEKDEYRTVLVMHDLMLGRVGAAEKLCRSILAPSMRSECLLRLAYVRGDDKLAQKQLAQLQGSGVSPRGRTDAIALAALLGETSVATSWLKTQPSSYAGNTLTLNGLVLLSRRRLAEAKVKLEEAFPTSAPRGAIRVFLWNRYGLACVLERQGRVEEAIARLEETPASDVIENSLWHWLACRAKLAELCRKAGRMDEAVKVEDDLRHYLSEADPDHPLLVKLNKVSSSRSLGQ